MRHLVVCSASRIAATVAASGGYYGCYSEESKVWQPSVPYGEWDPNWDGKTPFFANSEGRARQRPPTRHIVLIRHGQYDETYKEDEKRILTSLGRLQAARTGERLRDMLKDSDAPVRLFVSNMTRAKETAAIIQPYLPPRTIILEPDPNLAEGRPAQAIPGKPFDAKIVQRDGKRIEDAFRSIFYRATQPNAQSEAHEWDIVVCHGNVIRYMAMRALQLPPEAWLRLCTFNCSITYIIVRPSGSVSLRTLGDIGHLPTSLASFSGHQAFEW